MTRLHLLGLMLSVPLLSNPGTVHAAGMHLGVPFDVIAGLEQPDFQTSKTGWTAGFSGGLLRVFVGPSEASATEWILRSLELVARDRPAALSGLGDEAHGDGVGLAIVRDGNVALMVRAKSGARSIAAQVLGAIVDGEEPWPVAPGLEAQEDGTWRALAPDAVHLAYVGGQLDLARSGLHFTRPPRVLVAWDAYGRAVRQEFDAEGLPMAPPEEPKEVTP